MDDRNQDPVEHVEAALLEHARTAPDLTADVFTRARTRANGLLSPDP